MVALYGISLLLTVTSLFSSWKAIPTTVAVDAFVTSRTKSVLFHRRQQLPWTTPRATVLPNTETDSSRAIPPPSSSSSIQQQQQQQLLLQHQNQPSVVDQVLNEFQIWAIQNPTHMLSQLCLPVVSLIEGLLANNPVYLDRKRLIFGNNFCCAGQVVLGSFGDVEMALTSPQARTYRLGSAVLRRDVLVPSNNNGSDGSAQHHSKLFPLAVSDPQIKSPNYLVDGDLHPQVMEVVTKYIVNHQAVERQGDATAQRLLQELARDYRDMDHAVNGEFFTSIDRGFQPFLIRYQHYVLFGLDPDDQASIDLLIKLYITTQGTGYFIDVLGPVMQVTNLLGASEWPKLWDEARRLYKSSPVLAKVAASMSTNDDDDDDDLGFGISLDDLVSLMLPLCGIAAIPGPWSLARVVLGGVTLPKYTGRLTHTIDLAAHWDAIGDDDLLLDRSAVERHVYESGRLWPPVSATHRVATTEFTVPMQRRLGGINESNENDSNGAIVLTTFPQGTIILIPMLLSMLDEEFWGPTAYEYDASRQNLCPFSMLFHSVGDRTHGRSCPGKTLTMNLMVDLVQTLGRVRRGLQ